MSKNLAYVNNKILVLARNFNNFTIEDVSKHMNVKNDKIIEWESGLKYPTIKQAMKLAKFYRFAFAVFYLHTPPEEKNRIKQVDYRKDLKKNNEVFSRELKWFIEDIQDRRDLMIEIFNQEKKEIFILTDFFNESSDISSIALFIRNFLGIDYNSQKNKNNEKEFLNYLIDNLEKKQFLIFNAVKVQSSEMRGLSLSYETFPIIGLNQKDTVHARIFTLIHELTHVLLRKSSVCNDMNVKDNKSIESFCNNVAGLTLVDSYDLLNHNIILKNKNIELDDLSIFSKNFKVSKEVILYRLKELNLIDKNKYLEYNLIIKNQYNDSKNSVSSEKFLPEVVDKLSQLGIFYTRSIFEAYENGIFTLRDVSNNLLNLKIKNFSTMQKRIY